VSATGRFRARLHAVTQQWLRELLAEVVAAHTPAATKATRPRRRKAAAAVEASLHLSPPRVAVEKGEVFDLDAGADDAEMARRERKAKRVLAKVNSPEGLKVRLPRASTEVAKPEPERVVRVPHGRMVLGGEVPQIVGVRDVEVRFKAPRHQNAVPAQPKPVGAPALMGAPRAPVVGAGRGRTPAELSEVGRRGAEAAKASRATERALGPIAKTSMSDDELEAWASERLAAGDLPAVMTFTEEDDA
jgi:hypothetical protein